MTDISGFLLVFGLGVVVGNWSGGVIADRWGATRPLAGSLVVLALIFMTFSLLTTTVVGTLVALFIWGLAGSLVFIPQQHRLLGLAPKHANVILALNNSTLYLGIAGGAALGGAIFHAGSTALLTWVGMGCTLLALLTLFLSIQVSARTPRVVEPLLTPREEEEVETALANEETAL